MEDVRPYRDEENDDQETPEFEALTQDEVPFEIPRD